MKGNNVSATNEIDVVVPSISKIMADTMGFSAKG
jgi:hypothetical protein